MRSETEIRNELKMADICLKRHGKDKDSYVYKMKSINLLINLLILLVLLTFLIMGCSMEYRTPFNTDNKNTCITSCVHNSSYYSDITKKNGVSYCYCYTKQVLGE